MGSVPGNILVSSVSAMKWRPHPIQVNGLARILELALKLRVEYAENGAFQIVDAGIQIIY